MEHRFFSLDYGDRTALIGPDGTVSYSQLDAYAGQIAEAIGKRTLVFIFTSNSVPSIAGYVGCLNNSIVPVLIDEKVDSELVSHLNETYRPAFWWGPETIVAGAGYQEIYRQDHYILAATGADRNIELYPELALLITTSGSTGSPKLVRQSYKNLQANTHSIIEYLHIDENERAITGLPLNYVYGVSVLNTHLYAGASIVVTDHSVFKLDFWELFDREHVTSIAGVPYTYEMLNRIHLMNRECPSLRTMTQAGGKLNPVLHEKFAKWCAGKGINFVVMYGASEATARMGYLPPEQALNKIGSMGIAIPGGRFELVGADGQVIEESETVGEMRYYGENVTLGYAQQASDLAKGDENNGVLATGDMAKRDADGFYYIVGRAKRFLKIYGKRVSLDEVEQLLKAKFETMDIACGGVDDLLKVFILDAGIKDEVKAFIIEKTGINRAALRVNVIDEIPKNQYGKIMYSRLNEM